MSDFLSHLDWNKLALEWTNSHYRVKELDHSRYLVPGLPSLPPQLELRDYQITAIANWFKHRGRGTLKMATGSGKTITSLALTRELYEKIGLQVLLIVCPYRHLVTQ